MTEHILSLIVAAPFVAALILLFLPPYSPELNLIEILWKQAKYHWRSFATWAKQDLLQEVQALFGGFGTKFKLSYA